MQNKTLYLLLFFSIPGIPSKNAINFEIPETERDTIASSVDEQTDSEDFLEFGQVLDCSTSIESLANGQTDTVPTEDKYHFPIERFLRRRQSPSASSTEVEIISKESTTANPIVTVQSSSSSNGVADKSKSPELFTDSENELDETLKVSSQDSFIDLLCKNPIYLEKASKPDVGSKAMPKNVSTPISTLMYGQLQMETENSFVDDSSDDIFADITVKNRTDNVFEITENNAFGNKIQIIAEKERMSHGGDTDDVQFVCVVRKAGEPDDVINLDTEPCTPEHQIGRRTGLIKRTSSKSDSTPPQGWLTKSSRLSPSESGSPRTPTNGKSADRGSSGHSKGSTSGRRKKLESWFKDDDGLMSRQRAVAGINRRRSAPSGGIAKKPSPKKKCFQERLLQHYNKVLVSPSGIDSDFE